MWMCRKDNLQMKRTAPQHRHSVLSMCLRSFPSFSLLFGIFTQWMNRLLFLVVFAATAISLPREIGTTTHQINMSYTSVFCSTSGFLYQPKSNSEIIRTWKKAKLLSFWLGFGLAKSRPLCQGFHHYVIFHAWLLVWTNIWALKKWLCIV